MVANAYKQTILEVWIKRIQIQGQPWAKSYQNLHLNNQVRYDDTCL
jgi:hypothetical protein